MSRGYSKLPLPEPMMRYGGPAISGVYLLFLAMCIFKLATTKDIRRAIKVIFVVCCVMLVLACMFWMDYYANYPMWLYGFLEFGHVSLEVSVIERLASSWLTIYKRHISLVEERDTYSKGHQRASLAASLLFQFTFLALYALLYTFETSYTRAACHAYFILVELGYFIPYLLYSAFKLNWVIKQYLDLSYSRNVNLIALLSTFSVVYRIAFYIYFSIREGQDVTMLEDEGYIWAVMLLFSILLIFDIGFMLAIFFVLLSRSKPHQNTEPLCVT